MSQPLPPSKPPCGSWWHAGHRRLIFVLLLVMAGCTGQNITLQERNPQGFASWVDTMPTYHLDPGDRISVKYLYTPELNEEVTVEPDGRISLQATGSIDAMGMTPDQLTAVVQRRALRVLRHPRVSISVIDAPSMRIYVGGSVVHPGFYRISGRMGLLQAIILAGGFDSEARFDQVALIRRSPDNRAMLKSVNASEIIQHGTSRTDVPLAAGDIIYVPRNSISEVDLWVDQFINKFLPFQRGFDYTINRSSTTTPGF